MFEKYAVSIPLCLVFVGCLSFLSSRYGGDVKSTIKEASNAAGSCTEKLDETELTKKEPQLCSCGRHVRSDNYYCVEATYYDNSDSEEDNVSSQVWSRPDAPYTKAKSNSGKKVSSSKRQGLNGKESPNLKSPSHSYFEPPNNHDPSHSTPYRLGSGAFWRIPETDSSRNKASPTPMSNTKASPMPVSITKASPDPSSGKILKLEALLASNEEQRLQLDIKVRKELAALGVDREKAREHTSALEAELNQQRIFTAEAYKELTKYETAKDQGQAIQLLSEQVKNAQEEKKQLSSQLEGAINNSEQLEAELGRIRTELSTVKTQASNDVLAHKNVKDELRGVREELERTITKADESLTRHNSTLQELSGVRDELDTAKANAAKWENAYQDTQKLLSTAKTDFKAVSLELERALLELKQQPEDNTPMEPECDEPQEPEDDTPMEPECDEPQEPEDDTPMEPECNEPQDTDMSSDYIQNKVSEAAATIGLVRLELSNLDEKLKKKSKALKESKKDAKIKAKSIKELTKDRDQWKEDYELTVPSLRQDIERLEKIANANAAPDQAPSVPSVMNYTDYSQEQLVNVVNKYVQDCENLKLECERNRSEGKQEGYKEGLGAGRRKLAEQLVPLYLATGTRMARDFAPAVLYIEQPVGPDAKAVMTAKQTDYAELIQIQRELSRIMRESGLPAVQKIRGNARSREETAAELNNLQEDCSFSKRLRCNEEVQHSASNGPCDSTMSEEEEL